MHKEQMASDRIAAIGILTAIKSLAERGAFQDIGDLGRTCSSKAHTCPSSFSALYYTLSRFADMKDIDTIKAVVDVALTGLTSGKKNPYCGKKAGKKAKRRKKQ